MQPLATLGTLMGLAFTSGIRLYSTVSRYGLALSLTPTLALVFALGLFSVQVGASRWWLRGHVYGPLEWLWRSVTYWRRQAWYRGQTVIT